MMQRVLASRHFLAALLAMGTGVILFYAHPFPEKSFFLHLISLRAPNAFLSFRWLYNVCLFSTPYFLYLGMFSGLYVATLKYRQRVTPGHLPTYPDPKTRDELFLVVGEVHDPRKPGPSQTPHWLTIPERGLFTGTVILGAVGSGKTATAMYPFAEQILAFKAGDKDRRIGALVLEVKGDFCHKVRDILDRHGREEDFIEISLDSEYRYNPLHNDLDAYALAFNIASLLNNLFGRGKEPFWQQAYTNLVKFIILLHKIAYDYVTLFNVYECAISPPLLEQRIREADQTRFSSRKRVSSSTFAVFRSASVHCSLPSKTLPGAWAMTSRKRSPFLIRDCQTAAASPPSFLPVAWVGDPSSGVMFHSGGGEPMDLDKLAQLVIRPVVELIGMEWYGWHGFRRGIASNLYELGADEKIVQRVLRHAKAHVTKERYIKAFDPAVLAAMKRMETTLDAMKLCAPTVHQIN
jgi:hypothetical protein